MDPPPPRNPLPPLVHRLAEAVVRDEAARSPEENEGEAAAADQEAADQEPSAKRARLAGAAAAEEFPVPSPPRLLGQGKFGCVYSPPLPCPDGRLAQFAGDETKVSKYGPWMEIANELSMYRALNSIDPEFRFHLRFYGGCRVPAGHVLEPPCMADYLQITPGARGIIVMDRAGESLMAMEQGRAPLPENADLARSAENLVRGLGVMADNGIVYGDLHEENLVFGEDGLLRIIDFNRAQFTTPEQAHSLLIIDIEHAQEMAEEMMYAFPEREQSHPEEFRRLRAFVSARIDPATATSFSIDSLGGAGTG